MLLFFHEIDSLGNKPHLLTIKDKTSKSKSNTLIFESRKIQIQNSKVYFGNIFKGNRTYFQVSSRQILN